MYIGDSNFMRIIKIEKGDREIALVVKLSD